MFWTLQSGVSYLISNTTFIYSLGQTVVKGIGTEVRWYIGTFHVDFSTNQKSESATSDFTGKNGRGINVRSVHKVAGWLQE